MAQYVYTMNRVGKIVPPKRVILKDISLSFFPGAKIGVLGLNGSGKSTLLRIMAGVDREYEGEATPMPNLRIGYLPQEPQLDPAKDVRGNVEEGLGETMALVKEFNEISERFAEPMDDDEMNRLLERQGELQGRIDATGGWEVERKLDVAATLLLRCISAQVAWEGSELGSQRSGNGHPSTVHGNVRWRRVRLTESESAVSCKHQRRGR